MPTRAERYMKANGKTSLCHIPFSLDADFSIKTLPQNYKPKGNQQAHFKTENNCSITDN